MNVILDAIGLPPCDDIQKARKMIREACEKDRTVRENIDEVIHLAVNIVHGKEDEQEINMSRVSQLLPVENIKSFVS